MAPTEVERSILKRFWLARLLDDSEKRKRYILINKYQLRVGGISFNIV